MKKKVYLILLAGFLLNYTLSGQVTIGSGFGPVKGALLEIKDQEPKADNITSQTGGLVLPRVKLLNASTLEPFISTGDKEWINASTSRVKELHTGLMVYNLNTVAPFKQGIYIWDGTTWKYYTTSSDMQVLSSGSGITLNSGKVDLGGTLTANTTVNINNKSLAFTNGNIGIGTETPNASAALEINATNKGFLLPRVALTATNSALPITSPAAGLVVYNTANASNGATAVYADRLYMWNGSEWRYNATANDLLTAGSGITVTNGKIDLGGTLAANSTVNLNSRTLGFTNGSIGIGTASPASSAALDLTATNKGFLPPRVALTATNSALPITSPAVGLIVYNTANASSGSTAVYANNLYTWDGAKWSQLINQSTFDNTLQSSLNNLGVPRPAVFQLQTNIINFLNAVTVGASVKVPMSMLVNNLLDDISFNSATNTVTFKRGGLYTMTLVYEAEHNGTVCTLASYIVDFPDMNGARGDAPVKYTRIHSTAAFNQGITSNHGGTITCTAFVPTGRTWPIQLGRGQSGNCLESGCTLIGRSTHFVITKVGDLPPAGAN